MEVSDCIIMDENDEITLGQGCGHRITRGKGLSDGNDGASSRGEGLVQDEGESRIEARDRDISPVLSTRCVPRSRPRAVANIRRIDEGTDRHRRTLENNGKEQMPRSDVVMQTESRRKRRRSRSSSKRRRSRSSSKRRRSRSSSSTDDSLPAKRRRSKVRRTETSETSEMLDKFLSILDRFKGSDKPKLAFGSNNVIPEFDPMSKEQSMLTWLTKVEECAQIYGWDDKEIIHYSLPKLTGVAKTWYQGLPTLMFTWSEWKKKLIESFPCREDYAELLTEMLAKRVKYGESLEHYYYAKTNLLNRCKISGRQAVDCLLYGIEDRAVKVGAQAAQFSEPEQVLKYFRTVKVGPNREPGTEKLNERRFLSTKPNATRPNGVNNSIRCFNCGEVGHPSFRCNKTLIKCTNCEKLGHRAADCYRNINKSNNEQNKSQIQGTEKNEKQVSEVTTDNAPDANSKYIFTIKVNDLPVTCHVDLGSQCSLIRASNAKSMGLKIACRDNLPVLRGIGANLVHPLGLSVAMVEVQGLKEIIDMYVVEDYVLTHPVLLGHTFTERPDILITKTPNEIIFQRMNQIKVPLKAAKTITIPSNTLRAVEVSTDIQGTYCACVHGSMRGCSGAEYYLLPGMYNIGNGRGVLLIYNVSPKSISVEEGTLLTRALQKHNVLPESTLSSCSVVFDDSKITDEIHCNVKLSKDENTELRSLLSKYSDCFSSGLKDLGFTNVTEMVIELQDSEPVVYRPYRMSHAERSLVRDMVKEMVDGGIIRESSSPYASPIVLVQKKTGEKRLCIDYRALNRKTKKEHYPLPRVEDQLDLLAGNTLFTSLDLASGYYQIPIAEDSRDFTAFVTPDGQYAFNRMPFGLVNAPSVFQRTINKILNDAKVKYALIYMDDVLIPSKDFSEGMQRLEEVLQLLRNGGLTLKLSKCNFFLESIDFLGFEVSSNGIRPGSRKTDAVSKFPTPRNQHELRQFLGLSGFFRRFIKGYATITSPLTDLLKKDKTWAWGTVQDEAFARVKEMLVDRPVLALYDPKADTELHTDASKVGLAGILMQRNGDGVMQPVSYFSRKTTIDEGKMHSYELETLAVIASLNRFRVYLVGIVFKILTDCNALRSTLTKRDLIPRIARWWVQLQEYDCTIEYRPGVRMSHADALSRNPIDDQSSESHVLDILPVQQLDQTNRDWIATVQSADDEVKKVRDILSDPSTGQAIDVHKNYKLKNGCVYRVVGDSIKWLVPKGVRWQILKKNHDDVGHYGFEKTLQRIQEHYWFPKMRRFIKKYVSSCLECAHHKTPGGKREGELHPIEKVSIPFHTVHADHLGPFVKSKKGNCYLLVLVDGFTKFVNITPVKNTKSVTTVRVLKEHVSYFGVPTRLITDKGSSFTSKVFKDFITSSGIKHIVNAVATPRANGQVERFNRTILDALSASGHGGDDKSWDDHIPDIQVGINTTKHKTTQKSPSELLFGFNITSRTEGILNTVINDTLNQTPVDELQDLRDEASAKICEQQNKDRLNFNKKRKPARQYKEGDLVRVERQVPHDGKSQKLVVKYQGPYRIMKVLPNDRFLVEDTPLTRKNTRYEAIVSIDKIHPWLNFSRDYESDEPSTVSSESE